MAIDAYLKIGDIKGESTDEKHKQWVEISGVNFGATQPRASTVSGQIRPQHQSITSRSNWTM